MKEGITLMKKFVCSLVIVISTLFLFISFPTGVIEARTIIVNKPTVTLSKKVLYTGYKNYNIKFKNLAKNAKVTYQSNNTKVAVVSKKGQIKPISKGSATIKTVIKQDKKTYTYNILVTVKNPYVNITNKISKMEKGEYHYFSAESYGSDNVDYSYSIDNSLVAEIDMYTGEFVAKSEGTVKVTVADSITGTKSSCDVKITNTPVLLNKMDYFMNNESKSWLAKGLQTDNYHKDNYFNEYRTSYSLFENGLYFSYLLNSKYTTFKGTIALPYEYRDRLKHDNGKLYFYGDDILLYTSKSFYGGVEPEEVNIDITGVKVFKIVCESIETVFSNGSTGDSATIFDGMFYK